MSTRPLTRFDRLADYIAGVVAKPWFFVLCTVLVIVWAPSILVIRDVDTWQLIINTLTTIVTFLLVALLQNTEYRSQQALHTKLDAMTEGLADLMTALADRDPSLVCDVEDLRKATGLEKREGT